MQVVAPAPGIEVIETPTARTWMGSDGVLRQVVLDGARVGVAEARADLAACTSCAPDAVSVLVDLRGIQRVSRPAREFYGLAAPTHFRTAGILIESGFSMVIANFFIGVTRPDLSVRLFRSPDAALSWLQHN